MIRNEVIKNTVQKYLRIFPNAGIGQGIENLIARVHDVTSKKSVGGHITCSAVVLRPDWAVLMIAHKALQLWLLPGGHIEPPDASLVAAARREVAEETGILAGTLVSPSCWPEDVPIDIDAHRIPENTLKAEGAHEHWDFRYLFIVNNQELTLQNEEITGAEWRQFSELPAKIHNKLLPLKEKIEW
jgi:8-oxo-dGTP pyrophosphatase MutT (NUDIX family)